MLNLKQYWHKTLRSVKKPFRPGEHDAQSLGDGERINPINIIKNNRIEKKIDKIHEEILQELLSDRKEKQSLVTELDGLRREFELAGKAADQKTTLLEQLVQRAETGREKDQNRLELLERMSHEYDSSRLKEHKRLTRLKQRFGEIESEFHQLRDQFGAIDSLLADTVSHVRKVESEIKSLQARTVEYNMSFEKNLSRIINRQDSTDFHLKTMEKRLESEHQFYLNTVQEIQVQMRKQELRMRWMFGAVMLVLIMGLLAGFKLFLAMGKMAA